VVAKSKRSLKRRPRPGSSSLVRQERKRGRYPQNSAKRRERRNHGGPRPLKSKGSKLMAMEMPIIKCESAYTDFEIGSANTSKFIEKSIMNAITVINTNQA
jgi:hypothetical protein